VFVKGQQYNVLFGTYSSLTSTTVTANFTLNQNCWSAQNATNAIVYPQGQWTGQCFHNNNGTITASTTSTSISIPISPLPNQTLNLTTNKNYQYSITVGLQVAATLSQSNSTTSSATFTNLSASPVFLDGYTFIFPSNNSISSQKAVGVSQYNGSCVVVSFSPALLSALPASTYNLLVGGVYTATISSLTTDTGTTISSAPDLYVSLNNSPPNNVISITSPSTNQYPSDYCQNSSGNPQFGPSAPDDDK